jgi:hypothetical protein
MKRRIIVSSAISAGEEGDEQARRINIDPGA